MTQPNQISISTKTADATQNESEEESSVTERHGNETTAKESGANASDELTEPAKRISDYLLSIIAIGIYVLILGLICLTGGFNDFTNFALQKYIFSFGAFVALIVGLNFGYMNPKEKKFLGHYRHVMDLHGCRRFERSP